MRIVFFCHSLLSDWNHGNAHFLRGVVTELAARGHHVRVLEPQNAWSALNLVRDHGEEALHASEAVYPAVRSERYDPAAHDFDGMLEQALANADLVIVHEWSDHPLVARIGEARKRGGAFKLLFHDTHHRAVTQPEAMAAYDLSGYDGVLAFGEVLRALYIERGWAARAWTWHEAADVRVFRPLPAALESGKRDLVWVGNWGDDERTEELETFLLEPVKALRLRATVHGVRYPDHALSALKEAGITFGGWLANFRVPEVFAAHRVTVHVPRRPYVRALPGIPTIRVFEALACGIPLVSAPWNDAEGLFRPGQDYLVANDGAEMRSHLRTILSDPAAAREIAARGRATILARHTCGHRASELLAIARELGIPQSAPSHAESVSPSPQQGVAS